MSTSIAIIMGVPVLVAGYLMALWRATIPDEFDASLWPSHRVQGAENESAVLHDKKQSPPMPQQSRQNPARQAPPPAA